MVTNPDLKMRMSYLNELPAQRQCRRCREQFREERKGWICPHCRYRAHLQYTREWRRANRVQYAAIIRRAKQRYYRKHPEKWQQAVARRMIREPDVVRRNRCKLAKARRSTFEGNLRHSHRVTVCKALKGCLSRETSLRLLGCTPEYLGIHLRTLFKTGMTAKNYGRIWVIDHIKPLSAFNLNLPSEQEACFHFSNLQPLYKRENIVKGDKWDPADEWKVAERRRQSEAQYLAHCTPVPGVGP